MSYMKLEVPFYFRYSEFDIYDRVLPSSLFSAFQDIAGEHAERLGVGYKEMIDRDLIWVLVRSKYEILSHPQVDTEYILETWPLPKGPIDFNRDYRIRQTNGEVLIRATSKWAVTNLKTRKLVRSRDINYCGENFYPVRNFEEDLQNFALEEKEQKSFIFSHTVRFTDLDHNRHMNNTKYATLVLDAISPNEDEIITEMQINYLIECQLGDKINVYLNQQNGYYYVDGIKNGSEQKIFSAKVKIRN